MSGYYSHHLAAERLRRCYEVAPERTRRYLAAEIEYVLCKITPDDAVLELGCGYGRVMAALAGKARRVVGIDNSTASLEYGREYLRGARNCQLLLMDAARLAFPDGTFDVVACVQNGISAFHVDQERLIGESVRVARRGGKILFSSYSEKFWNDRLEWFRRQSEAGLVGEIDYDNTRDGAIVCKDGFSASTVDRHRFLELTSRLDAETTIVEVDDSSLFCEIVPR